MVTPEQQEYFVKFLKEKNIEYSTLVEDLETVQKLQIRAYLLQLATNYPTLVTVENIGFSYEGRPIVIAKISSGGQGSRPVIAIEAGIHAREWIAPATAVYIINQLVENSENSDLISNVDWHIVPVTNPDGYEFSHTTVKEGFSNQINLCRDRGLNPGPPAQKSDTLPPRPPAVGASSNPCSETYGGTHAFSESETVAYHNYILGNKDRIKLYLATHSYGNVSRWTIWRKVPTMHKFLPELQATQSVVHLMFSTRLWRKTRSRPSSSTCIGTDPNRNFGHHWMLTGASSNPCSETYGGTHAFSESETVAYHNYILGNKDRIKLYLATHSYGNDNLAHRANAAQVSAGAPSYTIGSSTNVLYAAAGGSDDWVKAIGGVDYAYTLELPGGGNSGFDLPASQIFRTVSTFFPAIRVMGEYIRDNFA
uniref:Peptidase M14 domain-containing protein n=1 Tax=Timema cristinae TaxID=61476 RepID=A0A7R9H7G2_TIMCR|nr:unnamed protein product [Timema cristinae]